jgi:hypothetical protein
MGMTRRSVCTIEQERPRGSRPRERTVDLPTEQAGSGRGQRRGLVAQVLVQRQICVNRFSAIDPVVLLHLRNDLRIGQLVRGFDSQNAFRQRLGVAQTLLELQLGLARAEDQKGFGLPQVTDDLVVVS